MKGQHLTHSAIDEGAWLGDRFYDVERDDAGQIIKLTERQLSRFYRDGDRVRAVSESWGEDLVPIGSVGTVRHFGGPIALGVSFDHDPVGDGTGSWAMLYCQIEHVSLFKHLRTEACKHLIRSQWKQRAYELHLHNPIWAALRIIGERMSPSERESVAP